MAKLGRTWTSEDINEMLLLPHSTKVLDGSGGDSSPIARTRMLRTKEAKRLVQEHSSRAGQEMDALHVVWNLAASSTRQSSGAVSPV